VNALRDALRNLSLPAVAKQVLVDKGVLAHADVRPPLRELTDEERTRVAAL
jgi:dihydrodipicolinate synthase/N-acetylneuraminate lyase